MGQMEIDFSKANKVILGEAEMGEISNIQLEVPVQNGISKITYSPMQGKRGFSRRYSGLGATTENPEAHVFCQEIFVKVNLKELKRKEKKGFFLEIQTSKNPNGGEASVLRKFLYCQNIPENRKKVTFQWIW